VFGGAGGGVQRRSSEQGDEVQVQAEEGVVLNSRSDKVEEWEKVERMGERNVYLVVKDRRTGEWGVPKGNVGDKEALHEVRAFGFLSCRLGYSSFRIPYHATTSNLPPFHLRTRFTVLTVLHRLTSNPTSSPAQQAATRHIHQNLGIDMDMWLVTRQPVGVIGGGKPKEVPGEGDNGANGNMVSFLFFVWIFFSPSNVFSLSSLANNPPPPTHPSSCRPDIHIQVPHPGRRASTPPWGRIRRRRVVDQGGGAGGRP
jgi:hypothetical protein